MLNLSQNKRLAFNIFVSYGRSLFTILCGLLTGRWALLALGEVNYGLLSLVGGLMIFVTFINGILAGSVARFYAFAVGEAQKDFGAGLEKCREWFNTALLIHSVLPLCLVCIGYPVGCYAIEHWLTIPVDRLQPCIWVWRFTCISGFISMVNVPFNSFFYAKQYFGEPAIYSVLTTSFYAIFLYYIVTHPGDWLVGCACALCLMEIIPDIIICIRAIVSFPECKFCRCYLWSWKRIKQLFNFAWWQLFGMLGLMSRNQGMAIVINHFWGPSVNAAMAVANHISSKATTFSQGIIGAFQPAIVNACGAKDYKKMRNLAFMTCRMGTLLTLLLVLPLSLELSKIVELWLKNPPQYTTGLCWFIFAAVVADQLSVGHMHAINANGKIALYQACLGSILILAIPLACLLIVSGCGVYSVGYALLVIAVTNTIGRVIFAKKLVNMSVSHWLFRVLIPLVILIVLSLGIGYIPHFFMSESIVRILVSSSICETVLGISSWYFVLEAGEKNIVIERCRKILRKTA